MHPQKIIFSQNKLCIFFHDGTFTKLKARSIYVPYPFYFTPISRIDGLPKNSVIDVIGILESIDEPYTIENNGTSKYLKSS